MNLFPGVQFTAIKADEYQDFLDWLEDRGMMDKICLPEPFLIEDENVYMVTVGFENLNDAMLFKLTWKA